MVSLPNTPQSLHFEIARSSDVEGNREEQTGRSNHPPTLERGPFIISTDIRTEVEVLSPPKATPALPKLASNSKNAQEGKGFKFDLNKQVRSQPHGRITQSRQRPLPLPPRLIQSNNKLVWTRVLKRNLTVSQIRKLPYVPLLFSETETGPEEPVEFYEDDYLEGEESYLFKQSRSWPQEVHEFSHCLTWKKCLVFDLDSTLHYFNSSCCEAAYSVLEYLSTVSPISFSELEGKYLEIRVRKTFLGEIQRISCNYDFKDRFSKLLHHFGIFTKELLAQVLDLYKEHRLQNLTIKPGVYKLLRALSARGKFIITLSTRTPEEQHQTIRKLRIEEFIHNCYTWVDHSTSQTNRLFDIQQELGLRFNEVLYFGSNCYSGNNGIGEDNIGDVNEARSLGFQAVCVRDHIGVTEKDDPFLVLDLLPLSYKHSRLVTALENSWQDLGNPVGSRPVKLIRFQNWDHVKFLFLICG